MQEREEKRGTALNRVPCDGSQVQGGKGSQNSVSFLPCPPSVTVTPRHWTLIKRLLNWSSRGPLFCWWGSLFICPLSLCLHPLTLVLFVVYQCLCLGYIYHTPRFTVREQVRREVSREEWSTGCVVLARWVRGGVGHSGLAAPRLVG